MWKYFVYTSKYTYIITIIDRDMIGDEIHIYDTLSGMTSHCDKHNRHIYDSVPGMMYALWKVQCNTLALNISNNIATTGETVSTFTTIIINSCNSRDKQSSDK